jgi:hypothetical protein
MRSAVLRRNVSNMGAIDAQSPRHIGPPKRPYIWAGLCFGSGVAFTRVLERHHLHIYQLTGLQSLDAEDHDCPAHRPNAAMAEWSILNDTCFQRQSWAGEQEPISRPFRECARAALEYGRWAGNGNGIKAKFMQLL